MAPRRVAFNIKSGRITGSFRLVFSEADKFARTKKRLRHALQQNKDLACALEAARARILKLESGNNRHDKVYGLCLPQIKAWTEDNVEQLQTIMENSLRSIRLVADILTPSQDLTLTEDGDDTVQELLQRSLHPPGSRLVGCPDLMDVEEEEEEGETDGAEDGDEEAQETQMLLSLTEDGDDTVQELLQRSLHPPGSRLVGCPDLMDGEEEVEEEGETDGAEDGDEEAQETQMLLSPKVTDEDDGAARSGYNLRRLVEISYKEPRLNRKPPKRH